MITMSPIDLTVAVLIIAVCLVLIIYRQSNEKYDGPPECFPCNKQSCAGCIVGEVKSAYVVREFDGKVAATCTLTFRDDFVIAQAPNGGDEKWEIPNLVGHYKTSVAKWVQSEHMTVGEARKATFA